MASFQMMPTPMQRRYVYVIQVLSGLAFLQSSWQRTNTLQDKVAIFNTPFSFFVTKCTFFFIVLFQAEFAIQFYFMISMCRISLNGWRTRFIRPILIDPNGNQNIGTVCVCVCEVIRKQMECTSL